MLDERRSISESALALVSRKFFSVAAIWAESTAPRNAPSVAETLRFWSATTTCICATSRFMEAIVCRMSRRPPLCTTSASKAFVMRLSDAVTVSARAWSASSPPLDAAEGTVSPG